MTEITTRPQPAPISSIRRIVARHPVAAFLTMMFTVNIMVSLSPVLTRRDLLPFEQAPYDWLVHILGSAVPAFLVTAALHGRDGVRDLAARCLRWRVPARWYVFALLGMPVAMLLYATALDGAAPLTALADRWTLLFTQVLPLLVLLVVFSNLAEEIGFTGFLFPRLQERYGPLRASVVITVPFALWHVPGWLVETGSAAMALVLVGLFALPHLASRVIVGWLYNGTGRSVLLVGLFHAAHNATVGAYGFARTFIPGSDEGTLVMGSDIVIAAALLIVVLTRGRLAYRPNAVDATA